MQRTSGRTHRPLLNNGDPRQILADLIDTRYPIYAGADIIFDCDKSSKEATRDAVLELLSRSFDEDGQLIKTGT
ncbi:MAG: shikimate kinase [Porticoccaceae bacterium]